MLCSYNYFPPRPSKPCVSKFDKQDITILSNKTHISLLYLFWSTKSNVFLTSLTFTIVTKGESSSYALVGTKCQMLATCHYTAKHVSCLSSLVWWILNTCLRLAAHSLAKNFTLTNHHQVNKYIAFPSTNQIPWDIYTNARMSSILSVSSLSPISNQSFMIILSIAPSSFLMTSFTPLGHLTGSEPNLPCHHFKQCLIQLLLATTDFPSKTSNAM